MQTFSLKTDIKHGGYKYVFSVAEIKVSGTRRNKRPLETTKTSTTLTATKTPTTVSPTTIKSKQTWTTKTTSTTTTTTTQRTSEKTTVQDYGKPESGRNIKAEPTGNVTKITRKCFVF